MESEKPWNSVFQGIIADDGTTKVSDYRVAHGTVTSETDFEIAESIVKSVKRRIPSINFDNTEPLTVRARF